MAAFEHHAPPEMRGTYAELSYQRVCDRSAGFGPSNVRVNAILPGAVDTDMYRTMNNTADKQTFVTNLHALKRVAEPDEIARSVLYLASSDAR
jgi:NAD(P)-dependent dehydrogenase (short-subunit alcohol dehydrogenase family)